MGDDGEFGELDVFKMKFYSVTFDFLFVFLSFIAVKRTVILLFITKCTSTYVCMYTCRCVHSHFLTFVVLSFIYMSKKQYFKIS